MKPAKVFLDTNIFLNTLLAEKDCRDCTRILANWPKMKRVKEVVTSCLSFANIAYIINYNVLKFIFLNNFQFWNS